MDVDESQPRTPFKASASEKSICRLNRTTCCSHTEIMSMQKTFTEAADEFKKKMDILENVMIMFQGEKYVDFLINLKDEGKEQCYNDFLNKFGNSDFQDVLKTIKSKYIDEIEDLLNDSYLYYKKILWHYGDSICAICNPKDVQDFIFSESGIKMKINQANCYDNLMAQEFELRTMQMYNKFLKPFTEISKCVVELN